MSAFTNLKSKTKSIGNKLEAYKTKALVQIMVSHLVLQYSLAYKHIVHLAPMYL